MSLCVEYFMWGKPHIQLGHALWNNIQKLGYVNAAGGAFPR